MIDLQAIFRTKEQQIVEGNVEKISLLSGDRLEILLRFILTIITAVLLLVPIIVLFHIQSTRSTEVGNKTEQILTIFLFHASLLRGMLRSHECQEARNAYGYCRLLQRVSSCFRV